MGANIQKIVQSNSMQVLNNISQISSQECVNICTDSSEVNITVVNSTTGPITLGTYCSINGASCALKAALSNELINTLTNTQDGSLKIQEDPWQFLTNLTDFGGSRQEITQENYQQLANNITQQLNSVCMNKSMNAQKINVHLVDATTGAIDYTSNQSISNTNCVIDNMVKNITDNTLSNSQTASIVKEGIFGGLGFLLIIAALVVLMHHNNKHRQAVEKINLGKNKK